MKISVVIPIYNTEEYLRACIDSVLCQDYQNIEIILVNDGSPDGCGAICDQYAQFDARICVIHKENGGLSDARNAGINAATGDFVMFLDSDDLWADPAALSRLLARQQQTKADVVNYSYVCWFEDTNQKQPYFDTIPPMPMLSEKKEQLRYLTSHGLYIASACNKLIRKSLLDNLPFRKGVYSEDIEWCARLMLKASSFDFVYENFYLYRQHSASIRHTINVKKCTDLANNILTCLDLADHADTDSRDALLRYCAFQYGTFFKVQAQADQLPADSFELLAKHSGILAYHGGNKKLMFLRVGCMLLGFRRLCWLIRKIMR